MRCIAVLGGSFDPIHCAHVALVRLAVGELQPETVRVMPAGNPWQKQGLQASGADRIEMARLAFQVTALPVTIDDREVRRTTPTYTIDTLRELRRELGPDASIVFLLGADQLQRLHTWREWHRLFDFAHLFAVSRPGCPTDAGHVDAAVAEEFARRKAAPADLRATPHGLACVSGALAIDISATDIRAAAASGAPLDKLVPGPVLDYIQQHHLYKKI
ncbi:MAG TPA: nicotinate-nucleotide adenylyltransferase [Paucimonas sp.]|nr:nicotinate-nucleotide adenylyltransferase [Paucimonas sp.]